ncbi:GNAT family protein [Vibrio sp. CAU 1672]|uniref:GNAT family N-acetyltransferase n=1 Tax=Vibrio sp. CAU 1672 TaxID=3032594 RepID=UPI0023D9F7B6|nr:GNAT family protein [Vibrio sp. CAU 1672]MDF2154579.1 GNAT family protein [Vibrio sp. CAU 1672]
MELVPFERSDYQLLVTWIDSEQLNYQWGGPAYTYPLTQAKIARHCANPDISPYLFRIRDERAGFVELRKMSAGCYRICRVFIADPYRGRGHAKQMLTRLIEKVQAEFDCQRLSLSVFEHNQAALSCYVSLGFEVVSTSRGQEPVCGRIWNSIEMEKTL